ncbi:hypothetical protein TrLO_g4985 [Triparma laevis f. longispina]|uniref:Fe2OG dioxygenase domain-containing protein n=1 Tax=Triparma laevis f. longispina TaxID=1714387 RepID=A0A9W7AFU4_9STRA|nr:hypothetical protein TrLO_g4985 [Triparma laevis f. longispina]
MNVFNFKEGLYWYQSLEYLCLKQIKNGGEISENILKEYAGNGRHGQSACLTELKQHALARKLWLTGSIKYPSNKFLKKESNRIKAYDFETDLKVDSIPVERVIEGLAYLGRSVLGGEICDRVIKETEEFTKGWTTTRHYEVPTHDIPISSIPEVLTIFNTQIQPLLKNLIQFNFSETEIIIHDAFIVKYEYSAEGGGNTGLPMHYDQSEYSFTVGLNEGFEGGGTFIRILEKAVVPGVGDCLVFKGGKLEHGGQDITEGVRYVLVVFGFGRDGVGWGVEGVEEVDLEEEEEMEEDGGTGEGGGGGFSFGFDSF